ncbi:PhzF family phenazine biosynthesis protein [Phyllobacterium endophyticum]|jgi:trans-2,3-dihydro-3-hydroxyanthranilate isomerase|uniref:Phenazine biosynthesis protein PhzF n=1 Tax=Phyllobacterium endophyticum TaxID=1149773 RepID=A0A2P7ANC5_9HYPH|nr:PhzF family phenazine biosynthesis protein [Phyllobacterium endophyticum]MBB3233995.1 trans-2,3-dihydro-3-hydroxyanthranilate isomerase [Phyllobacterium endophyticum]PSH55708.1 phenazine biosynthesis protein PhzF [Phyllobacterium endophyticum]TYR43772.1 PhzF family phenazine biosynthesis protein [Phyllobacterium endophyticum]
MDGRRYEVYDVFTDKVLAGNPLAIVHDTDGLDGTAMQRIAREFNLSETVFILPARNPAHTAWARIFTPDYEMPFAGHPTVGTAIALAHDRFGDISGTQDALIILEEQVGPVRCGVRLSADSAFAEFDLPKLPQEVPYKYDRIAIASALRLEPKEIGFENHVPSIWDAGVPFLLVPVHGLKAAERIVVNQIAMKDVAPTIGHRQLPVYAYCRETVLHDSHFHARMFVSDEGTYEDPATGSATAAFAGAIHAFDEPLDGVVRLSIEQGYEMGRPSRLQLELDIADHKLAGGRIGGSAVKVAEGRLLV